MDQAHEKVSKEAEVIDEAGALKEAQEGVDLREEGEYQDAASKISGALAKLTKLHGETSPKLAKVYFEYGLTLLREHQTTQDILNPDAAVLEEAEKQADAAMKCSTEAKDANEDTEDMGPLEKQMDESPLCLAYAVFNAARLGLKDNPEQATLYVECHNALGECLHEMNNFEMSADCYAAAVELLNKKPEDEIKMATALGCQAMALRYGEKIEEAKKVCEKALVILRKDEAANIDRIEAIQLLFEDCDTDFQQVQEEAKNATVGTHTLNSNNSPDTPVNVLQPKKKRKVATAQPTP